MFISSIRVDPRPTHRGLTSLLALKIHTPMPNTGKLRPIGQMPVVYIEHPEVSIIAVHVIPFDSVVALPCFHHKKEIPSRFLQLQGEGHHHLGQISFQHIN